MKLYRDTVYPPGCIPITIRNEQDQKIGETWRAPGMTGEEEGQIANLFQLSPQLAESLRAMVRIVRQLALKKLDDVQLDDLRVAEARLAKLLLK